MSFSKVLIEDVNYIFSHEDINPSFLKDKYSANIFVLLKRWQHVVRKGLLAIRFFLFNYNKSLQHCDYLFFSASNNNFRSLKPIQEKMEDNAEIVTGEYDKYPAFRKVWFYGMLYSPVIFWRYLKCSGYLKKAYSSEFISFCLAYGYLIESKRIFQKTQPSFLIVANDHFYPQRAFFRMAQALHIKTVYVQHASVTEKFPPLEYDYAFLDGQESLEKYTANNKICKTTIFLTGNPRFDIIKTLAIKSEKNDVKIKLGIAINVVDIAEKVEQFIGALQVHTPQLQVAIRPHPALDISYWKGIAKKYNCTLSDSRSENPFCFISQNDYFISGESSFHLDVALSGKSSYYYNFTNEETIDHYGYIRNGLVEYFSEDVLAKMLTKSISNTENEKLAQYYVANYATSFWGKASDVIALTIKQLHENNQYPDFWVEQEFNGIKYFELKKRLSENELLAM